MEYDLQALLNPVSADQFLARDYGRSFVHVRGTPGKFASLLPWPVLNDILEQHRLDPPRLRLTREGKPVPPDRYVSYQPNRRKSGSPIPRLNAAALTSELREGATLVLDNVDELHRPIRRLAESLEQTFRVRVQVNSYSGWRTSHGFDLHWDDHDVFILQVAGRKHWKVYGMTRPWPLARDSEPAVDPPSEVLWDGLLEDGDLLYIPRGWWHVATPLDEPTLHLTVGINNPTGIDFLSWFVDRLRDAEVARQDLPHLQGPAAMRAHAELLRQAILDAWQPELLEEYLAHLDRTAKARPSFALPWSATPGLIPDGSYTVRWIPRGNIPIEISGDQISIATLGRRWKFRREARPLLELLMPGSECSQSELESIQGDMLSPAVIRAFLKELAVNGLVVIR
ncbi:MAG TPA: cupin domain-containing protein [Bryobacteraceae bacterium]|nr:cupin domain-containing protein [Bryobacteraceae bacterium]